jgi:predicted Zn-dependent peptidase
MITVNSITLPNGLRLIHNYDSATAMVALHVSVDVGSADEDPKHTGLAHLMEHLMFGGSANVPDFDRAIESVGGVNNAYTSTDRTIFYSMAPAQNAETLFWAESDRLLSPLFSDKSIEVQRSVVIEEFKQTCLNQPYGDTTHLLRQMVYTRHPYRWPVIGLCQEHIAQVERQDICNFFDLHYTPANITIVVTGHITWDDTRRLTEKWFGTIPARTPYKRQLPTEPQQTQPREIEVVRSVPNTTITIAYPMPGFDCIDYRTCDILTDLLAAGRAGRLRQHLLLNTDLFAGVDACILGSRDPGYITLTGRLRRNTDNDIATARHLLIEEATKLSSAENIDEHELQRVRNRFASEFTFGLIDYLSMAQGLIQADMQGYDINDCINSYNAVSATDIAHATTGYIRPDHANTLIYRTDSPS